LHFIGDRPLFTAMKHGALHRVAKADRPIIAAACHLGIGDGAPVAHGLAEFGKAGDPAVDGSRRHVEQLGKLGVGGAQQAMIASLRRTARKLTIISLYENTSLNYRYV
jgi:hypothetical protein